MRRLIFALPAAALSCTNAGSEERLVPDDLANVIEIHGVQGAELAQVRNQAWLLALSTGDRDARTSAMKGYLGSLEEARDIAGRMGDEGASDLVAAIIAARGLGIEADEILTIGRSVPRGARALHLDRVSSLMSQGGVPLDVAIFIAERESRTN